MAREQRGPQVPEEWFQTLPAAVRDEVCDVVCQMMAGQELSYRVAGLLLGVKPCTVEQMVREGTLVAARGVTGRPRVLRSSVDAHLAKRRLLAERGNQRA